MRSTRRYKSLIAVLASIAFLAIEAIALAHEIEHDLEQHNESSCALHLYIGHAGTTPNAVVGVDAHPLPDSFLPSPAVATPVTTPRLAYRGRAPPALSC
jgi:hypothetical protein